MLLLADARAAANDIIWPRPLDSTAIRSISNVSGGERIVPITLQIDKRGKVKHVRFSTVPLLGTEAERTLRDWLNSRRYAGGSKAGKGVSMKIAGQLHLQPSRKAVHLLLPVDARGAIDFRLAEESRKLNRFPRLQIDSLARFRLPVQPVDTVAPAAPQAVVALTIDRTGELQKVEPLPARSGNISQLLANALLYSHLSTSGKGKSSVDALIVLRGHSIGGGMLNSGDTVAAATSPICFGIHDTSSVVLPPLPMSSARDRIVFGESTLLQGEIVVALGVDTTGRARAVRIDHTGPAARQIVKRVVARLRFFPATTLSGEPVPFVGLIQLTFQGDRTVLLRYSWEAPVGEPFPRQE